MSHFQIITEKPEFIANRYEKSRILGEGSFGKVFLARDTQQNNKKVAIKVIDKTRFEIEEQKMHSKNEIQISQLFSTTLKHKHIVDVFNVIVEKEHIYIVEEYIDGGQLSQKIESLRKISEHQAKIWFRQLLEAVAYIHKHRIVHHDLKLENILLDTNNQIHVCDFGFGKIVDSSILLDVYCGSPSYAAPEVVMNTPYHGPPVDMWSCGVILYIMLTGKLPFDSSDLTIFFESVIHSSYDKPAHISEDACDLIKSLLCVNPKKRITVEAALKHSWLKEVRPKQGSKISRFPLFSFNNFTKKSTINHPFMKSTEALTASMLFSQGYLNPRNYMDHNSLLNPFHSPCFSDNNSDLYQPISLEFFDDKGQEPLSNSGYGILKQSKMTDRIKHFICKVIFHHRHL